MIRVVGEGCKSTFFLRLPTPPRPPPPPIIAHTDVSVGKSACRLAPAHPSPPGAHTWPWRSASIYHIILTITFPIFPYPFDSSCAFHRPIKQSSNVYLQATAMTTLRPHLTSQYHPCLNHVMETSVNKHSANSSRHRHALCVTRDFLKGMQHIKAHC